MLLIGRLVACSARISVDTQTGTVTLAAHARRGMSAIDPANTSKRVHNRLKEFQQALGSAEIIRSESLDAVVMILSNCQVDQKDWTKDHQGQGKPTLG